MKRSSRAMALSVALVALTMSSAVADPLARVPFTQSLSNTIPLTFGMSAAEAANALRVPLVHVSGPPGNELLAAVRPSSGYFNREARLFLQFRGGRLSGWKGDWGRNWMWE